MRVTCATVRAEADVIAAMNSASSFYRDQRDFRLRVTTGEENQDARRWHFVSPVFQNYSVGVVSGGCLQRSKAAPARRESAN